VDLNAEAIQICQLSLWIKTAARGKQLTSLDHSIREANSVISDPVAHPKAFDQQATFPEIFAQGGFDVRLNRAEPSACGYSRGPRRLDSEAEMGRTAGPALNAAGNGFGKAQDDQAGFQPYRGKPAVRNEPRGWRNRRQDLTAICHDARRGRHSGSHWSKPVAPPLYSTSIMET
jgi:hypothetical protein